MNKNIEYLGAKYLWEALNGLNYDESIEEIGERYHEDESFFGNILFFSNFILDTPIYYKSEYPDNAKLHFDSFEKAMKNDDWDKVLQLSKYDTNHKINKALALYYISRAYQQKGFGRVAFVFGGKAYRIDKSDSNLFQMLMNFQPDFADLLGIRPREIALNPNGVLSFGAAIKLSLEVLSKHEILDSIRINEFRLRDETRPSASAFLFIVASLLNLATNNDDEALAYAKKSTEFSPKYGDAYFAHFLMMLSVKKIFDKHSYEMAGLYNSTAKLSYEMRYLTKTKTNNYERFYLIEVQERHVDRNSYSYALLNQFSPQQ